MSKDPKPDKGGDGPNRKDRKPDRYAADRLAAIRRKEKLVSACETEVDEAKEALKEAKSRFDLAVKGLRDEITGEGELFERPAEED